MTSWEYFIGFEREPANLEAFLNSQGLGRVYRDPQTGAEEYESRQEPISLFYLPAEESANGEIPNWGRLETRIIRDITLVTKDSKSVTRAEELAKALVREYDAVLYDLDIDEFFRKDEI